MSKKFRTATLVEYMEDLREAIKTDLGSFRLPLGYLDYSGDGGNFGCLAIRLAPNLFATIASGFMKVTVSSSCDLRAWDIETLNAPGQMSEPVGVLFLTYIGVVPKDEQWDEWLCDQDYNQNEDWLIQECLFKSLEEAMQMLNVLYP